MISVVIPVYNAEKTIFQTLESVRNQTYKGKIEIIVVNDGSTDGSSDIINNYIAVHNNLDIKVINKSNGGVSTARNTGISIANGKYIALLDSDDTWDPNKLERQMQVLSEHPEIDFLGTNRNGEFYKKVLWKKFELLTKISPKFLLVKNIFVIPTIIFKTEVIRAVGNFNEQQKHTEDTNFFLKVANKYNCYLLNESLAITGNGKAHFGASGLSANIKEMEKGELKNMRMARDIGIINRFEYAVLVIFSLMKYLRRVIIVRILR
jgi:glycosyltransferase involved in cell wall biosynthesis